MKYAIYSSKLAFAAGNCAVSAKRHPGEQEVKQEVNTCLWINNLLASVFKGTGFTSSLLLVKVIQDSPDTFQSEQSGCRAIPGWLYDACAFRQQNTDVGPLLLHSDSKCVQGHFAISQPSKCHRFFACSGRFLKSQHVRVFVFSQSLPACFDSGSSMLSSCLYRCNGSLLS